MIAALTLVAPARPARTVTPAELRRLRAVEAAATELVRKLDEHTARGYDRIRLGALRELADALNAGGAR